MQRLFARIKTYYQLGVSNILNVALYRLKLKHQYFVSSMPIQPAPTEEQVYFQVPTPKETGELKVPELKAFGWLALNTDTVPNWLASVTNNQVIQNNQQHWSNISDFDLAIGDIKTVWEHSRFNWLFPFVISFLKDGDEHHLDKLNQWLNNWVKTNPTNQGVNWKCGQEASIRVIHLVAAHHLLWQNKPPSEALATLIYQHLLRIAPTISYAIAQDNNHGTSEASALFVGSTLLWQANYKSRHSQLTRWISLARKTIENRCARLIASDGCFSQNSTNYHRLMLDSLSFSEYIRQYYQLPPFSASCYQQLQRATAWLAQVVIDESADSVMLGLNDGAQLLPVTQCDYLDIRPSVQWATQLFFGHFAYPANSAVDQLCKLFPPTSTQPRVKPTSPNNMSTDYHSLKVGPWQVFMRTPSSQFRPSQCDALHLDVWHLNKNILLSSGSFSYNDEQWQNYFPSTSAHNTVSFDDDEQMPKLSRFLYCDWLKVNVQQHNHNLLIANYVDRKKRQHLRRVNVNGNMLRVNDIVKGFQNKAVLRLHLPNDNWQLTDNRLQSPNFTVTINATTAIDKIALVAGWQSRYYQNKTPISVLEVTVKQEGTISTELCALL